MPVNSLEKPKQNETFLQHIQHGYSQQHFQPGYNGRNSNFKISNDFGSQRFIDQSKSVWNNADHVPS